MIGICQKVNFKWIFSLLSDIEWQTFALWNLENIDIDNYIYFVEVTFEEYWTYYNVLWKSHLENIEPVTFFLWNSISKNIEPITKNTIVVATQKHIKSSRNVLKYREIFCLFIFFFFWYCGFSYIKSNEICETKAEYPASS